MGHMSSKMLLRPHEILLLSNNGLRASLRPHYNPRIISKWQRQMILAKKTVTVLPVLQQMPPWISSQAAEAQAISQNLCSLRFWLNRMAEVIVFDTFQKRTCGDIQLAKESGFNWNRLIVLSIHLETVKESRRIYMGCENSDASKKLN